MNVEREKFKEMMEQLEEATKKNEQIPQEFRDKLSDLFKAVYMDDLATQGFWTKYDEIVAMTAQAQQEVDADLLQTAIGKLKCLFKFPYKAFERANETLRPEDFTFAQFVNHTPTTKLGAAFVPTPRAGTPPDSNVRAPTATQDVQTAPSTMSPYQPLVSPIAFRQTMQLSRVSTRSGNKSILNKVTPDEKSDAAKEAKADLTLRGDKPLFSASCNIGSVDESKLSALFAEALGVDNHACSDGGDAFFAEMAAFTHLCLLMNEEPEAAPAIAAQFVFDLVDVVRNARQTQQGKKLEKADFKRLFENRRSLRHYGQ
ncbi:MAG: hypothetical protein Q7T55_14235, partial [Solirubrobacteraceae bacterium]|nr:hypothetical protein [Solirubrobacteraceae bacterium]